MRDISYRAKRKDNGEWVYGVPLKEGYSQEVEMLWYEYSSLAYTERVQVLHETVGQYTGLLDKDGKKIFEGDIVQYQNLMEFDIQSVVKFGEYKQDGSSGEYGARRCLGFYVEVDNFTCPDWCENEPTCFNDYWRTENLLQVNESCEVIGNVFDNPELLEVK